MNDTQRFIDFTKPIVDKFIEDLNKKYQRYFHLASVQTVCLLNLIEI